MQSSGIILGTEETKNVPKGKGNPTDCE